MLDSIAKLTGTDILLVKDDVDLAHAGVAVMAFNNARRTAWRQYQATLEELKRPLSGRIARANAIDNRLSLCLASLSLHSEDDGIVAQEGADGMPLDSGSGSDSYNSDSSSTGGSGSGSGSEADQSLTANEPAPRLSKYELQRLQRIKRNNGRLKELGLLEFSTSGESDEKPKAKKKKKKTKTGAEPTRRSTRERRPVVKEAAANDEEVVEAIEAAEKEAATLDRQTLVSMALKVGKKEAAWQKAGHGFIGQCYRDEDDDVFEVIAFYAKTDTCPDGGAAYYDDNGHPACLFLCMMENGYTEDREEDELDTLLTAGSTQHV
jgi:hypothetical protein